MAGTFVIQKRSIREESVYARSADSLGLTLGEIRAVITASEGLDDKSLVLFANIKDSIVEGEHFAGSMEVRERSKIA